MASRNKAASMIRPSAMTRPLWYLNRLWSAKNRSAVASPTYRRIVALRTACANRADLKLAREALGGEADDHLVGALVGKRLAEQITLDGIAAEVAHTLEVFGGLDALGGDRH